MFLESDKISSRRNEKLKQDYYSLHILKVTCSKPGSNWTKKSSGLQNGATFLASITETNGPIEVRRLKELVLGTLTGAANLPSLIKSVDAPECMGKDGEGSLAPLWASRPASLPQRCQLGSTRLCSLSECTPTPLAARCRPCSYHLRRTNKKCGSRSRQCQSVNFTGKNAFPRRSL